MGLKKGGASKSFWVPLKIKKNTKGPPPVTSSSSISCTGKVRGGCEW